MPHPQLLWIALGAIALPACWIIAGTEDFTDATPSGSGGAGGGAPCTGPNCKGQGDPCDQASECTTGFCDDGVCCDRSCDGPCRGCANAGEEGTCVDTPLGPDPEALCAGFGVCDGAGHCGEGEYVVGRLFGGGDTNQTAYAVAPTSDGSFFLAGATHTNGAPWMVDNVTVGDTTIGNIDWFFAHFDDNGGSAMGVNLGTQLLISPISDDQIVDTAVDENGNIYMAGWLNGTIQFGVSNAGTSNMAPDTDAVLLKLSPTQSALWARPIGVVASFERGRAVAIAPDGGVVWGGEKQDGMFLEVVDADSTVVQQRVFGGGVVDSIFDIAIDASNTVAVGGTFRNAVDFGNGVTLTPDGPPDSSAAFVAVFDEADGPVRWAQPIDGPNAYGAVNTVAIGPEGHIYAGGYVRGTEVSFGGGLVTLPAGMVTDSVGFVVSYDSEGQYRWHQLLNRGPGDSVTALAIDTWGNVLAAGFLTSETTFGDVTLTHAGGGDAFALKLSPSGEAIWGRSFGDAAEQVFHNAAFDGERFYLVGGTLGAFPAPNGGNLSAIGEADMVFAILTP